MMSDELKANCLRLITHHSSFITSQMSVENDSTVAPMRRPWWRLSLTGWILVGLVAGGVLGRFRPDWGNAIFFLRDIFLNMIKSVIAPLVFSTLVVGIAGGGDLKKVGRMGAKALLYFEVVTTAALFIGLAVVNLPPPGGGAPLGAPPAPAAVHQIVENHPKTLVETIVHIFPASVVD